MKGPLYTTVFKESWNMVWHHKKLLWFGFLAAFIGSANIFEFLLKAYYRLRLEYVPSSNFLIELWDRILEVGATQPGRSTGVTITLMVASTLVFLILLYFFISAQGALIAASAGYLKHKERLNLKKMWNLGRSRFWPLLVVNLTRILILLAFLVILAQPLIALVYPNNATMGGFIAFVLIVAVLLGGILVSLISLYASMYIILHGHGVAKSVRKAFVLFGKHWLISCEVGLLMLLANIGTLLVTVTAGVIIIVPIAILLTVIVVTQNIMLILLVIALSIVLIGIIGFILAVYTTWIISAWTSLFLHMDKGSLVSRFLHWTKR
jgi:hypothetical protein